MESFVASFSLNSTFGSAVPTTFQVSRIFGVCYHIGPGISEGLVSTQ